MNSFPLSIGAGGEEGEQNQEPHAVYYIYGIGSLTNPPQNRYPGETGGWDGWNMARKGRDILPKTSWRGTTWAENLTDPR